MGMYVIVITFCAKSGLASKRRKLSVQNFDRENVDELIKNLQILQYFLYQKYALYGI